MAWAFQDSGIYFSGWDNGAAPVTVSVNEGDLIVVGWGTEETADVPNGVSDEDGNSYTLGTLRNSNDGMLLMLAYATAKSTNGTCTITATYSAGNGGMRGITAMVFTPDAGDTFELEDNSYVESIPH